MPVPKRRKSRSLRDRGRTHKKLSAIQLIECKQCSAKIRPHRICPECGYYKERPYRTIVTS